ncbi:non-specific lipid-transfer protein 1-like [Mercurialis annua]|uniref:non-specific lipid-transfer protein 1-like n=1 Tax=Mercurialis annua TaxID=3986 RepID=UPI00215EBAE2|nr:non-specific lipid-transfer protein 1-like [Mercurialis annua]
MAGVKIVSLFVVCMVIAPMVTEAITCGQISSSLAPCVNYLRSGGPVPPACCNGVRSINSAAKTTPDRQAACNCLKKAAGGIPGINQNLAGGLPGKCGVNIPYKISMSTNCASVK